MPSSTTNTAMNNNHRKRTEGSLSNTRKLRRSELVNKKSKDERPSRSLANTDSFTKSNHITQEYALTTENNFHTRLSTLRPLTDSYDNNNSDIKRDVNANKRDIDFNENTSHAIHQKSPAFSFMVKSSTINRHDETNNSLVSSYDSDEDLDKPKQNSNKIVPMVVTPIITSSDLTIKSGHSDNNVIIQPTDSKSNSSAKLLKLVVPQSIKMLSSGDGLSSALRIPTKIQLTKTSVMSSALNDSNSLTSTSMLASNEEQLNDQHQILSSARMGLNRKQQSVVDYPLTPPPPMVDQRNTNSPPFNEVNEQDRVKAITTVHSKGMEDIDSSTSNEHQTVSKRHLSVLSDWSVPPTSELSPTSLTSSSPDLSQTNLIPDDSLIDFDSKINRSSVKRRYRSLSFSCPALPYYTEKSKPITPPYKSKSLSRISNSTNRKMSPVMKSTSIQRLKKRRKDSLFYVKRSKLKTRNDQENTSIMQEILNDMIKQVQSRNVESDHTCKTIVNKPVKKSEETRSSSSTTNKIEGIDETDQSAKKNNHKTILPPSKTSEHHSSSSYDLNHVSSIDSFPTELNRQTSTPLSFHSILSSTATDEQSLTSPYSQSIVSKTHIFTDIVNELIKGAKGLDKLSYSLTAFTNSIHDFVRLTMKKQHEKVESLHRELDKKCSSQLNRANIFCTQKIQYFITKHSIMAMNEYIDELTLIVKYFYLYILSLNCRKQENEMESILNDLIHGKLIFNNETFYSSILTTIIEDYILTSTFANEYLLSQPMIINQMEYSLPFLRNSELENELLHKNEMSLSSNPFSDFNDLEDYLNRCEHMSAPIPCYPVQQPPPHPPPVFYSNYPHPSASAQYYYPPTQSTDMAPYYYSTTPTYATSQQSYAYNHSSPYYNPLSSYGTAYSTNEQYNYHYNQQTSYSYIHANSTNDIPLLNNHQSYRRMNSNIRRKYSNTPAENSMTSGVFDTCNVDSSQSKATTAPNTIHPS